MPSNGSAHHNVTDDLVAWQATGDERCLERVIRFALADLQRVAIRTLRKLGIRDPSAADEAVSLVFDHVRRLAVVATGEQPVAPFDGGRRPQQRRGDPGMAYLMWLTEDRARDVARSRRRLVRQVLVFAEIRRVAFDRGPRLWALCDEEEGPDSDHLAELRDAIARMEPRLRTVIESLLEGKSQAVIAHMLDVCEGTVSRLRARAVSELRALLADTPRH